MHSEKTSAIEMEVFIKDIEHKNLDIFSKHYTMQEHFAGIPKKEGKLVAKEKFPQQRVAVHVNPISDKALESAIRSHFHIHTSEKLFPRIHNPMCPSFISYKQATIIGRELLILEGTTVFFYAEVNHQWQLEYQSNTHS